MLTHMKRLCLKFSCEKKINKKAFPNVGAFFFVIVFMWALNIYAGSETKREEYKDNSTLSKKLKIIQTKKLNEGIKFFVTKKYDLAEAKFKNILLKNPKNALAYFNLGLTKYKQRDYPEAIKNFDVVTKMPSYYAGAAVYYKSISQLNLGKPTDAIKTAKQYKNETFFYKPVQALIETIETGSDEHFENAKLAATDANYELCLLEMNQSVLTDTYRGRELITKCIAELKRALSKDVPTAQAEKNYYKLYLDAFISKTDNVYQQNKNTLDKLVYFTEVGGEYLYKNKVDIGIGFNYNLVNAVDLDRFKVETYNLHIPTYYRANSDYFGVTPFYEINKYVDEDSYSDVGISFFYSHLDKKNYRLGLYGSAAKRASLNNDFDYKAGTVNVFKLYASRFIDELSISASVAFEQDISGVKTIGAFLLPYANDTITYDVGFSYDFDKYSVLKLKYSLAVKDYAHIVSPNKTDRKDNLNRAVLTYHYLFNKNIKAFLQQSFKKNDSNYGENEFINKNYNENVTAIGLSLIAY